MRKGVANTVQVKSDDPGDPGTPPERPVQPGSGDTAFLREPEITKSVMPVVSSGAQVAPYRQNRIVIDRTGPFRSTFATRYADGPMFKIDISFQVVIRIDRQVLYLGPPGPGRNENTRHRHVPKIDETATTAGSK